MFKGIVLLLILFVFIALMLAVSIAGISGVAWLICWAFNISYTWNWIRSACVLALIVILSATVKAIED